MEFIIPEYGTYKIENLVFDYNGTLAEGGKVKAENFAKLKEMAKDFNVYVITADTFGSVKKIFPGKRDQVTKKNL